MRYLMTACLLLAGCAAFDMADLGHTHTVTRDNGTVTEVTESHAKVRGKPAQEFEMELPGMAVSVREIIDPAEFSKILYWIGGVSVILAVVMGKIFGWGFGIIMAVFGASLIAVGRLMAASPWVAVAPGVILFVGAGYVLWRLHQGKVDHEIAFDASDELTEEQKAGMSRAERARLEKLKGKSFFRRLV